MAVEDTGGANFIFCFNPAFPLAIASSRLTSRRESLGQDCHCPTSPFLACTTGTPITHFYAYNSVLLPRDISLRTFS